MALLCDEGLEIKCRRCKRIEKVSFKNLVEVVKDRGLLSPDPSERGVGAACLHPSIKEKVIK